MNEIISEYEKKDCKQNKYKQTVLKLSRIALCYENSILE